MENKILEALSQVPALVEATQMSNEIIQEQSKLLAKISERNVHANIPDAELEKVTKAVEERVMATTCSLPDTESLTEELADGVLCKVTEAIMSAVEEKIKDTPVKLEHHHTHATTYDLAKYADKGARNLVLFLAGLCTILTLWSVGSAFWYFQSESYWAKEYRDILFSDVTTETEMKQLREGTYTVGCLPREFSEDPGAMKVKIKQNKAIIEQRRRQAEKNKGRYSSQPALVR